MEVIMPVLKSLSFTALPKPATDPVHIRRAKLISRLEEQRALLDDPNLIRTVQRTVKDGDEKRIVTKQQKVRPWWRADAAGHLFMSIRAGGRAVEFEKGTPAISPADAVYCRPSPECLWTCEGRRRL